MFLEKSDKLFGHVILLTTSWRDLLHTPIATIDERDYLVAAIERVSAPVTVKWLMGRIATLQAQYYTTALPEQFQEAIADDWHHELREYPAWAIAKAVRWWMSRNNDKRRYKPVAGDISERARFEMGIVKVAQSAVRRFDASAR